MNRFKVFIPAIFFIACLSTALFAGPVKNAHVEAELVSETKSIRPGETLWLALRLRMEEGWHTYWKDPGDSGLATSVQWDLPEGFEAGGIEWPRPERIELPPLVSFGYEGEVFLPVRVRVPVSLEAGSVQRIGARVKWLSCKEMCVPGKAELSLELPVSAGPSAIDERWREGFAGARRTLGLGPLKKNGTGEIGPGIRSQKAALLFAFLGGLILNLMPCVFPVLSLKVLAFVNEAGEDRKKIWLHGLVFTGGVLVSFWALAGILLALRAAGSQIGWGFQLQSPAFLAFLAVLFFFFSLNLFGVFEIGTSLTRFGGSAGKSSGWMNSFLSGVLATAVATPCTAPFMGSALAFALSQPVMVSFRIFTALGLGMAFPYLALSCFPSLLKLLPRPGMWMVHLKRFLGLLLLLTVVWLVWVFGLQTANEAVAMLVSGLFFMMLGMLMLKRGPASKPLGGRSFPAVFFTLALRLLGIALLIAGLALAFGSLGVAKKSEGAGLSEGPQAGIAWERFSTERLDELKAQGTPVFIDFTAAWCLTCQVNERLALNDRKVVRKFRELGIVALKADWTRRDEEVTQALARFGRSSVPLYVLYGRNGAEPPVILPELITPKIVLGSLGSIEEKSEGAKK